MTKRIVIAWKYFPTRLPLGLTVLYWLFFDRIGIPPWGWGVFWTIVGLFWISALIRMAQEESGNPWAPTVVPKRDHAPNLN